MRVDMLMNKLCLVKSRSIAKNLCDKGLVKINGIDAKASSVVKAGDEIEYAVYGYKTLLKILDIPKGNVSKKGSGEYYSVLKRVHAD